MGILNRENIISRTQELPAWQTSNLHHLTTVIPLSYIPQTFRCHRTMDNPQIHLPTKKLTNKEMNLLTFVWKSTNRNFLSCSMSCLKCFWNTSLKLKSEYKLNYFFLFKISNLFELISFVCLSFIQDILFCIKEEQFYKKNSLESIKIIKPGHNC